MSRTSANVASVVRECQQSFGTVQNTLMDADHILHNVIWTSGKNDRHRPRRRPCRPGRPGRPAHHCRLHAHCGFAKVEPVKIQPAERRRCYPAGCFCFPQLKTMKSGGLFPMEKIYRNNSSAVRGRLLASRSIWVPDCTRIW